VKKTWVWVLLLLSLGVNVGILATIGVARFKGDSEPFDSERFDSRRGDQSPDQRMPRERFKPPNDRMANALKLEGEEREEFVAIQERFFQSMMEQREGLERIRRQLRAEVVTDQPDEERIEMLLAELGQAHSNLDRVMVDNVLRSRQLLGPEQQRRYFQMLRRIREATERGRLRDRGDDPRRQRPRRRPPG
jgi:Spy/CpxP family protein refolding chaperone